jgi:hypothetical protein
LALAFRRQIVKRCDRSTRFCLLPRRWVVEPTFAWLNRNRRLPKDFEMTVASSQTWIYLPSVQLLARRLARSANYSNSETMTVRHNYCDSLRGWLEMD